MNITTDSTNTALKVKSILVKDYDVISMKENKWSKSMVFVYQLLMCLDPTGKGRGVTVAQLAEDLDYSEQTVVTALRKLEKLGMLILSAICLKVVRKIKRVKAQILGFLVNTEPVTKTVPEVEVIETHSIETTVIPEVENVDPVSIDTAIDRVDEVSTPENAQELSENVEIPEIEKEQESAENSDQNSHPMDKEEVDSENDSKDDSDPTSN